ncbi:MAG: HAD-IB family hydrolase, partial [Bacteroidota bacterium]
WKGKIHRLESVSKPFIKNGIRLAKNRNLIPTSTNPKTKALDKWLKQLNEHSNMMEGLLDFYTMSDSSYNQKPKQLTIPGSEIKDVSKTILDGEDGPHIAAFFDLDRTLISGFSAKLFIQERIKSGKMTPKEAAAQFSGALVYALGNKNFAGLAALSAKGVQGMSEKILIELGEEVYLKHLAKAIFPQSRALVEAHMAKGHTVAIVSAATPYQVEPAARDLGIKHVMCTRMNVENGKFTGGIQDPPCWGDGKAILGQAFADKHGIDMSNSYFYTDSFSDLPLLEIVGNPKAVNPDKELTRMAMDNEWTIYRFDDLGRPNITNILRTGATLTTVGPAIASGLLNGILKRDWTQGTNSMMAMVGDLGTRIAGIKVVVKNEDNMWNARPAVFIFNHQSNVDLMIMAKLLRKDAVGIAKKELQYSPLGPIFKAAGMIFIDRSNREKAIEALKPAVEALKTGTSIGLAPEGTRSYDYNLGKFKKGAFHMAMQAKVPIVPVVIKNAHDAMPRGSSVIRPAIVEVKVLSAIPTKNWKRKDLDKNIKKIRDRYLKELGQTDH